MTPDDIDSIDSIDDYIREICEQDDRYRRTWEGEQRPMLLEIDFEANTWVQFATFKDGTQTSASGDLKSVTQSDITLGERSYADGTTDRATISRLSGAYSSTEHPTQYPGVIVTLSGSCNKTTKPLPSSKF